MIPLFADVEKQEGVFAPAASEKHGRIFVKQGVLLEIITVADEETYKQYSEDIAFSAPPTSYMTLYILPTAKKS